MAAFSALTEYIWTHIFQSALANSLQRNYCLKAQCHDKCGRPPLLNQEQNIEQPESAWLKDKEWRRQRETDRSLTFHCFKEFEAKRPGFCNLNKAMLKIKGLISPSLQECSKRYRKIHIYCFDRDFLAKGLLRMWIYCIQTSFIIIALGLVTESQLGLEVPHKMKETIINLCNCKNENVYITFQMDK